MNQQSVNVRDIQAAGGLEKWMRKAAGRGPQATERPLRDIVRECADRAPGVVTKEATHGDSSTIMRRSVNATAVAIRNAADAANGYRNKPRPAAKGRKPADATLGYVAERMNKLEARWPPKSSRNCSSSPSSGTARRAI